MSKKNKMKKIRNDKNRMIKEEHVWKVNENETILIVKTEQVLLPVAEIIEEKIKEEIKEIKEEIKSNWRCVIC